MKKTKLGRRSRFFAPEAFLFILASLLIVWFFGLIYLLFFLFVLLCTYMLIHLLNTRQREQTRLLIKMKALADARLSFLRRLIVHAYETDRELFHRKFTAAVSVGELRRAGVIEVDSGLLNEKIRQHMEDGDIKKALTDKDIELCCLLLDGFSPCELSVVYSLKSVQNAYMKRHRLKGKLDSLGLNDAL